MQMAANTLEMRELTRRRRVSVQLEQELQARGVAQAIVFVDSSQGAAAGAATAAAANVLSAIDDVDIVSCFVKDERSISASLSSASLGAASVSTAAAAGGRARARASRRSYRETPVVRKFPSLGIILGDVHSDGVERLAENGRVRYVASSLALSLVRPVKVAAANPRPNTTTWGIDKLEIPKMWAAGLRGNGVRVGHLDTGVDANHPALRGAVGGYLFTDNEGFGVPEQTAFDTGEHGTHTAGTIAGRPVDGRSIGVAPAAMLYSSTVIEFGNVVARILTGLDWAASQGIKVLSMSLGLRGYHDDFRELMSTLRGRGILPVIAVGNEGPGTSRSPGNYEIVLSVGACDATPSVADFSSSQWFARPSDPLVPDLVAPGVDVISAKPGGGYQSMDGSSMATPHIAGLAALLWQAMPSASVAQIESAIQNSCVLGAMPHDRANRGLPNGPRAFRLLTGSDLPVPSAPRPVTARAKKAKKKSATSRRAPKRVARRVAKKK